MGIGRLERLNVRVACLAPGQNSTARGLDGLSKQKPRPWWGNWRSICVWHCLVILRLYFVAFALPREKPSGSDCLVKNTNPGRWRRNWTRTPMIPQSDLRSWSATNKEVLRKSQRGKYEERNSWTGITHEWHCVCTKWLNQMTQGRASSATNRPKSDLLG